MPIVVPTITESSKQAIHARIIQVSAFAHRIHIDFADGEFAPTHLGPLDGISWPEGLFVDMHVMYQNPIRFVTDAVALKPDQITMHAESDGDLLRRISEIKSAGIRAGVAILPNSQVTDYARLIEHADSVLIFGGRLGYHGSILNESQLDKVSQILDINHSVEIAWDGGINVDNAAHLVKAGVQVLNVGGAIAHAHDQLAAFSAIQKVAGA